jgi:hypothetical protein
MLTKLNINQILERLFEAIMTYRKKLKQIMNTNSESTSIKG